MKVYYAQMTVSGENYYIFSTKKGLLFVGAPNHDLDEIQQFYPEAELVQNQSINQKAIQEITEYLNGERKEFDIPIDIQMGTELQRKVWLAIGGIPRGTTINYSKLAKKVGQERAIRAVATAVARNPLMIVLPCHRVVRKDGSIGQYRGGSEMKKDLLKLESFS
ncbi:methylated-DNA--[protein]-cysteine S-methyltransferase [Pediococcus stilesii]|nr:methylated-DNA--[protein]-cysteine S-methyltransferase [Pediococcus stilesii]